MDNSAGFKFHSSVSDPNAREYARLRKISGGTRSEEGRRCRKQLDPIQQSTKTPPNHAKQQTKKWIAAVKNTPNM